MARARDPDCKQCRREGIKLYLKGERCYGDKCAMERKPTMPGEHSRGSFRKSEYYIQLRMKQRAKRIYGVLENQFRRYYEKASRQKGITGENLLIILEMRLDNAVYRMKLASSRAQARQFVRHGNFEVNGKKVDIPSYQVKEGDIIMLKEKSRSLPSFIELAEAAQAGRPPNWLEVDYKNFTGKVKSMPEREDIDVPIQERLIIELYSK